MTRAELRNKILFERWLQSDGDLTFGEWLDSLRERAKQKRNNFARNYQMQQASFAQMTAMQQQANPFNLHQMGGDNPLAGLGGLLGGLFPNRKI